MNPSALRLGRWLFRYRSLTPLPVILLILFLFPPRAYGRLQLGISLAALILAFLGEGVRMLAVGFAHAGTSGREAYLRADALNVGGVYSLVRNPLYIGNLCIHGGILIFWGNPAALLLMLGFLCLQYSLIILGEEAYLQERHGEQYTRYRREVPRIIPRLRGFRHPGTPFNWRRVVLKENDSVFNMLGMFLILWVLKERMLTGSAPHWFLSAAAGGALILFYAGIKVWKKRTPPDPDPS